MIKLCFEKNEIVNVSSFPSFDDVNSDDVVCHVTDTGHYIFNTQKDRVEFYSPIGDCYYDGTWWMENEDGFSSLYSLVLLKIVII